MILVGDLFYERDTAARALAFLDRHVAAGTRVLIGDPGRTYLPKERLTRLAEYSVPVTRELEDLEIKRTTVWGVCKPTRLARLRPPRSRCGPDEAPAGRQHMTFAGINYLAILIAAVVGWLAGAVWYGLLGKAWVAAQGRTMEEFKAQQAAMVGKFSGQIPFILAFSPTS